MRYYRFKLNNSIIGTTGILIKYIDQVKYDIIDRD